VDAGRAAPTVALLGYTNAGKSLLHSRLAGLEGDPSRAHDSLFASLDTCQRAGRLPDGSSISLVDTVGFVRNLSHALVDTFRATLAEATSADLLLLVVDRSSRHAALERASVLETLRSLGVGEQRLRDDTIEVWNKCDLPSPDGAPLSVDGAGGQSRGQRGAAVAAGTVGASSAREVVSVSALTGEGCDSLAEAIAARLGARAGRQRREVSLRLDGSASSSEQLSFLHGHPRISVVATEVSDDGERMRVTADMDATAWLTWSGRRWGGAAAES
jgi:GTP-binding protein HflX